MSVMGREQFLAAWDRQVGCPDEYDPAPAESVWSEMVASDSLAATWGTGMRRAPTVTVWGWNGDIVAKLEMPVLLVSGQFDKTVLSDRVRDLYNDLPSNRKVFVDLACSSHNAMWERNHALLFRASVEWLTAGTISGKQQGVLRLGYPDGEKPQSADVSNKPFESALSMTSR